MEPNNKLPSGANREILTFKVHRVLAHSYTFFFSFLIIGVLFDIIFKLKLVRGEIMTPIGFAFLFFATVLIIWAQKTSRELKVENMTVETFCRGPYCYTRVPTHLGLLFMALGFGFVLNATFVIIFTIFSFIINKFVFLREEERILLEKYGNPYMEYKKKIKF